jgi:hypothetical protein
MLRGAHHSDQSRRNGGLLLYEKTLTMDNHNLRSLLHQLSATIGNLKETIKTENRANEYGLNILTETKVLQIFNVMTGYDLTNANFKKQNFPGVDGIDDVNRVMAQVTSTFSKEKIMSTIDKIISNKLYLNYSRLVFIFLSDKKKLTPAFQKSIREKLNGKLEFDFSEDLVDLGDFYRYFQSDQDLVKIFKTVTLLDELLKGSKKTGLDLLSVCFHDEELDNAYKLVDFLLQKNINVYISSQRLYKRFENHPVFEYLILATEEMDLSEIKLCIAIYSNGFIEQIVSQSPGICFLFSYAVQSDSKIEIISFYRYLRNLGKIKNPLLVSHQNVENIEQSEAIKRILETRKKVITYHSITADEIQDELLSTNRNFSLKRKISETDFMLLRLEMNDHKHVYINYLILARDYNLANALKELKKYNQEFSKHRVILVPQDMSHRTRKRLDIIKSAFSEEDTVNYLEEYLFDSKFKSYEQTPKSNINIDEFIYPGIKMYDPDRALDRNEETLGIVDIIYWIYNLDASIGVITGSGGIGKTTVCERIHDMILEDGKKVVIFIESEQYIKVFQDIHSLSDGYEYDLYNIYRKCQPRREDIDAKSFYLNYAMGNIIIIFDGIDEIISTIPTFSLRKFLDTVDNIKGNIGKGKILINCRDAYASSISKFYKHGRAQIYELLGFDEKLARIFFTSRMDSETKVESCMQVIREFNPYGGEQANPYPPFMLEVVAQIVGSNFDYEEIDSVSQSSLLLQQDGFDILIHKVCNREYFKKAKFGFQLSIDQQIRFLCELASEEKGNIKEEDFPKILAKIQVVDRAKEVEKGLKDHPLLISNGRFTFRFEFLNNYFKSIAIFNLLFTDSPFELTDRIVDTLAYDCNFNSLISTTIIAKALKCQMYLKDCLPYVKKAIVSINGLATNDNRELINRRNKCVTNIVVIILKSQKKNSLYKPETIIRYLFEEPDSLIKSFYFFDVPSEAGIVFDFSDLFFSNCQINGYSDFFHCTFNDETFFDDTCEISNVLNLKVSKGQITARESNFDKNIRGDNSIFRTVAFIKSTGKEIGNYFKEFFDSFYIHQEFKSVVAIQSIRVRPNELVSFELLATILKANSIIEKVQDGRVHLNEKLKRKIVSFIRQGLAFTELNRAIAELRQNLLTAIPREQQK